MQRKSSSVSPFRFWLLASAVALAGPVSAQTNLYWGDLHLHTNLSTDAFATGNKGIGPNEAYRFAKGIPVYHPNLDTKVQIDRPLDFLAITDHATNLGIDSWRWPVIRCCRPPSAART